jgi:DNA-binding HxlR family transcriptional regulator
VIVRWNDIGDVRCSVARALSVVGDAWTLLILRDCFLGIRRFDDFQEHLGISRHLLADRLRDLVEHGVLDKVPYQVHPDRFEYRLSDKGRALHPVVVSLMAWGDTWMGDPDGAPVTLVHRPCGHEMTPVPTCPECGEVVTAAGTTAVVHPHAMLRMS